jgi:hypothetical protein
MVMLVLLVELLLLLAPGLFVELLLLNSSLVDREIG